MPSCEYFTVQKKSWQIQFDFNSKIQRPGEERLGPIFRTKPYMANFSLKVDKAYMVPPFPENGSGRPAKLVYGKFSIESQYPYMTQLFPENHLAQEKRPKEKELKRKPALPIAFSSLKIFLLEKFLKSWYEKSN